jgi:hypothetical protein
LGEGLGVRAFSNGYKGLLKLLTKFSPKTILSKYKAPGERTRGFIVKSR